MIMAVEIGELRARLVAESNQMKREIRAVKQEFSDLGAESKKTAAEMEKIALTREKIGHLTQTLDNVNARIEIQQQKLERLKKAYDATFNEDRRSRLQEQILKTEASLLKLTQTSDRTAREIWKLEDSLSAANKELDETDEKSKKASGSMQGFASAIAALGAGAAFSKLKNTMITLAEEANQLANSYSGLASVAKSYNVDVEAAADLADRLADRWGMNRAVIADTVKTYLSMGLTLQQTEDLIIATADAAAYNREAHLSWDEAIRQVARGIKQGNSNLTDAAGITTNLSVMYERYARSIGTTAAKLTEAQKVQAAYNGMMQEAAIYAGNADEAMSGYTGIQATYNQTIATARQELGEAFIPVLQDLLELVTPLIREFALFAEGNKEVVAGVTAAAVAITGLIAVVGALTTALLVLNAAMGPVGWAVLGIGALITGTLAYSAAADAAAGSVWKFAQNQEELNRKLDESPLKRTSQDVQNLQADIDTLNELLDRRRQLEEQIAEIRSRSSEWSQQRMVTPELRELGQLSAQLAEIDKQLSKLGIDTPDKAPKVLEELNKQLEQAIPAMLELNKAEVRELATQVEHIDKLTALRNRYEELNRLEELSAAQRMEMTNIVRQLKEEYPNLLVYYDDENQLRLQSLDVLDQALEAETNYYNARAEKMREDLENMKQHTTARLELLRTEVESLQLALRNIKKVEENPSLLSPVAPELVREEPAWVKSAREQFKNEQQDRVTDMIDEISTLERSLIEIDKRIASIQSGNYTDLFTVPSYDVPADEKKKKTSKTKTREEIQREQFRAALDWIRYRRELNRMSEQEEIDAMSRLLERFKGNAEITRELEVAIYRVRQQMAEDQRKLQEKQAKEAEKAEKERFEASAEWIEQEERRMTLAGRSEEEIARMKLEAWTRVRNRYEKDSEYYKKADTQVYNLRVWLMRQEQRAAEELAKERERQINDVTKAALSAIEKQRKAELDALDERRKAIQKFYDEQLEAIDDSERLKERNELIAEMEKYRYATSEKGQKHFQELQEKLRQMDVEDQKRSLEKQRDQELEALERRKADIESWYNDLREATQEFTGDLTTLYKLADDERLASFITTNQRIKEEMAKLTADLAALSGGYGTVSPGSAAGTTTGAQTMSIIQQMQANSAAWHSASPDERQRLQAENQRLAALIGATFNSRDGRWYKGGVPLYHTGGIAGMMNFRSPDILLPNEIAAILKVGEVTLTDRQIGSLVDALSGRGGGGNVYIEKMYEINDPVFEDGIDLRTFERESGNTAAEVLRKKLAGGGG